MDSLEDSQQVQQVQEGWTNFHGQSRKWHWIGPDGRSLCGKWGMFIEHDLDPKTTPSPDNCAGCWKRLATRGG